METFEAEGPLTRSRLRDIAKHVQSTLQSSFPEKPRVTGGPAVACGGNADALARLAPGIPTSGFPTLDAIKLRRLLPRINSLSIPERMEAFDVKQDRAEVMGIAAIILTEVARWFAVGRFAVPGVGVRDGIVRDLALRHFGSVGGAPDARQGRALLAAARRLARKFRSDAQHGEQVRRLSLSLFDQMSEVHGLGAGSRLALGLAAEMHEMGRAVADHNHPVHGSYLLRHAEVPGLESPLRDIVVALVRYQRGPLPDPTHDEIKRLTPARRREVRALAGMLRVAHGLDSCHGGGVEDVRVRIEEKRLVLSVRAPRETREVLERAGAAGDLLRKETGREIVFRLMR
jgi:exopolyphosphatase/guanosine-5'-triphosphate,3'-diphosphate pyrophosphatase